MPFTIGHLQNRPPNFVTPHGQFYLPFPSTVHPFILLKIPLVYILPSPVGAEKYYCTYPRFVAMITALSLRTARIAGLLYLIVVLTGIFSLAYVPGQLINAKDAVVTTQNIMAHETLFRAAILSSMLCYTAFLLLPLVLYRLLHGVHKTAAQLMVAMAVVSVPISIINLQHKWAVVEAIQTNTAAPNAAIATTVLQSINAYNNGILLVSLFWGLWLLPFGYLVYRSGFLPKLLGILLMLGCLGYLINLGGYTLLSNYSQLGISQYISLPASIGEIGTCLWLLIAGIKIKPPNNN